MAKKKRRIVFSIIRFIILFAVALGAIYLINTYVGAKRNVTYEAPLPLVVPTTPETGDISRLIVLPGYIEADAMIPVVPLVSGTVVDYPVTVGQKVAEGDIIAKIDDEPLRQQMLQAQAAYLAYESTFKRVESLYGSKNTTVQNYEQAKAQRDAAKAQYDLASLQVDYATVRAKASGTVLTAPSAKGSTIAQGSPLAVIADLDKLVVNLKVPEKDYDIFIKHKDEIVVTIVKPESGESVKAEVVTIDPFVQAQSKMFGVKCELVGDTTMFRPGMYIKANLEYDWHHGVPVLPQTVRKADGSCYLYDEATETVHHIEFTPLVENETIFMVPDEYAGKTFVSQGQNSVFDGQSVRVKDE